MGVVSGIAWVLKLKNTDSCAVTDIKRVTRVPSAETVVRLRVPIVVRIRGGESLVVRLVRKNFGKPTV